MELYDPPPAHDLGDALVPLGIGAVFLGVALLFGVSQYRFRKRAWREMGTILRYEVVRGAKGSRSDHPVVEFMTPMGERFEFRSPTSVLRRRPIGARVEVLYDPMDPHKAQLGGFTNLWLGALIAGLVGGALSCVGLVFLASL